LDTVVENDARVSAMLRSAPSWYGARNEGSRSATEMGRLVEGASHLRVQATNLVPGRQTRKSRSGCGCSKRRGSRKTVAGETAVKGGLGVRKEEPEEGGIPRGDRAVRSLNNSVPRRIRERSKALKTGARFWRRRATAGRKRARTPRGPRRTTSPCGCSRGKTPEGRIPDVAAG
jgi:hypothetical protein